MKPVKFLGLILACMCVLGVTMVSSASAGLPTALPEKVTLLGTSSLTKLKTLAGTVVECATNKDEGTFTSHGQLGPFKIDFETCKGTIAGIKLTCTGLGEATGVILANGEFHLVYDKLGTGAALGVGILFLLSPEVHFECPAGGTLVLVKGEILCLVTPVAAKVTTAGVFAIKCEQTAGDQTEVYFTNAGATVKPLALSSFAGGTFESSGEEGLASLHPSVESEIMG